MLKPALLPVLLGAAFLPTLALAGPQAATQDELARVLAAAQSAAEKAEAAASAARAATAAANEAAEAARQARELALSMGVPVNVVAAPVALPSAVAPVATAAVPAATAPEAQSGLGEDLGGLEFGFTGYMRTGMGTNSEGGDQTCFGLPGVSKYRLGNECETYGELVPSVGFPVGKQGLKAVYTLGIGYYNRNGGSPSGAGGSESVDFDLRQNWIGFTGFQSGLLEGSTVWAGRRYYRRHDVHINDIFYWSQRGQGIGIEDISTPVGKLSLALLRSYNNTGPSSTNFTNGVAGNSLDIRLAEIPTNHNGKLELGLDLRQASEQGEASAKDGFLVTAEHTQDQVWGGSNRFTVQYGSGAGANLSTNDPGAFTFTTDDTKAFRVINQLLAEPNPNLSVFVSGLYESTEDYRFNDRLIGKREWLTLGARPQWYWSDHLSSALEVGYDTVRYSDDSAGILSGTDAQLVKLTVAPVILKLGRGFFNRPELRLFGTCARWNGDANLIAAESGYVAGNLTGNSNYLGKREGCSFGAQVEAWW